MRKGPTVFLTLMKSKQYIFVTCRIQDKHSDLVFEVKLNCHVTQNPAAHCPNSPLNLPWGPQLLGTSLWTHGRRCATPPGPALSLLPSTASDFAHCNHRLALNFKRARTSHGSCAAGKRIHTGGSPECAGGRTLESCSCVLLPAPFTEDHKGKWGPMRLSRKWKVIKIWNFQGDPFIKRLLGRLYLTGVLHGVFSNSKWRRKNGLQDFRFANFTKLETRFVVFCPK